MDSYRYGALSEDRICFKFNGSAGQSFCAWVAHELTLDLEGDANDYVRKGSAGNVICSWREPPSAAATTVRRQPLLIPSLIQLQQT